MKKINVNQMENLNGGISAQCAGSILKLGAAFATAFFVTTPVGAAVFLGSFVLAGVGMKDCN